jgi:PAS domain S-box-containing protein
VALDAGRCPGGGSARRARGLQIDSRSLEPEETALQSAPPDPKDQASQRRGDRPEEHLLRHIFDHSPDAIGVHWGGKFLYVNPSMAAVLGYERPEELVGSSVLGIVHPESRAAVAERVRAMVATGGPVPPLTEKFLRRDGSIIEMEVAALPIEFEGRAAIMATGRDVTARRLAEMQRDRLFEDLRRSLDDLRRTQQELVQRERLAAVGQAAAVVSHEIRNPLGVMANALSGLRKKPSADPEVESLLAILVEEVNRLDRIVGDLLDFARPMSPTMNPQSIEWLLEDALKAAAWAQPDPARVQVERRIDAGLPPAEIDGRLVRQALLNLLVNALQAMPRGGTLEVGAALEERAGRRWIRVDVADSGPGIPAEVLPRVFEPFFTTRASGTGLGLAVVKRVVDGHGGSIEVQTVEGRGTRFVVLLAAGTAPLTPRSLAGEPDAPG